MAAARAYLDYNASAPLLPAARAAMLAALDVDANPSSVHAEGRQARRLIEAGAAGGRGALRRREPAACRVHLRRDRGRVNAAHARLADGPRAPLAMSRLYVSAADHPCLLSGGRFHRERVSRCRSTRRHRSTSTRWPARSTAMTARRACRWSRSMLANNETGVIQPVARDRRAGHGGRRRARRRRGAGGRTDSARYFSKLYADFLILVGAQDRRAEGRRRTSSRAAT